MEVSGQDKAQGQGSWLMPPQGTSLKLDIDKDNNRPLLEIREGGYKIIIYLD